MKKHINISSKCIAVLFAGTLLSACGMEAGIPQKEIPVIYEKVASIPGDQKTVTEVSEDQATIYMALEPWYETCTVEDVTYNESDETATVYIKKWMMGADKSADTQQIIDEQPIEDEDERAIAIENGDDIYRKIILPLQQNAKSIHVMIRK